MDDGRSYVLIPDGYNLKDTTDPQKLPARIAAAVTVDDHQSLTDYTNRFKDPRTIIIGDYDAGTITAHLDYHSANDAKLSAQAATHTCTLRLRLRDSEEYTRWNIMQGDMHSQEAFALFIEENVTDVADPDHSVLIEICRDLEATTNAKFKSGTRLENGDRTFVYKDETQVKNDMVVPSEIKLLIPLYLGEPPVEIIAKFRFKATQQGLLLGFRWHRVEYQRQATFTEMARTVSTEADSPSFTADSNKA
jgi:hypothetical protein